MTTTNILPKLKNTKIFCRWQKELRKKIKVDIKIGQWFFQKKEELLFFISKQLEPEQWLELFNIYETLGSKGLWYKYAIYREIRKNTKYLFFKKYKKFLYYNRDIKALISMTGKVPKNAPSQVVLKIPKIKSKFGNNLWTKLARMK